MANRIARVSRPIPVTLVCGEAFAGQPTDDDSDDRFGHEQ